MTDVIPIRDEFPTSSFPVVYVDGVTGVAPGPHIVKFVLSRLEPSLQGQDKILTQPIAQIAMPLPGFLQMAFFFENAIKDMQTKGLLTAEQLAEVRKSAGGGA